MALFRRQHVHTLKDKAFGAIAYEEGFWASLPGESSDRWRVVIEAPSNGPSDEQRVFFQRLIGRLEEYKKKAITLVEQQTGIKVVASELQIYAVEIGNDEACRAERFVLELSDGQAHAVHRVNFAGGRPEEYGCDD